MTAKFLVLSLLIILIFPKLYSQDSLYLVATLTGESTENSLDYARGLGDINGDDYADIIVSFSNYCNIYLGGDPFDWQPDITFIGGRFLVPCDVNNDNYDDFIISYRIWDNGLPVGYKMKLYFGGAVVDTIPDFEFIPPYIRPHSSFNVNPIGNVNGDDYNDFVISCPYNWTNGVGHVYLFFGGESINPEPDLTFTVPPPGDIEFGDAVSGTGDANQDGYDDILISEMNFDGYFVNLYYGGSEMDTTIDKIFTDSVTNDFGNLIFNTGNLNGDSFNDFIITSGQYTYIYLNLDSILIIHSSKFGFGGYICSASGGDINNDGFDELIIIAPSYPDVDDRVGKLYLYSCRNFTVINEIKEHKTEYLPDYYYLQQNYPNPFNASTKIEYYLAEKSWVTIKIFNCLGEEIRTYYLGTKSMGKHSMVWNGTDNKYRNVASGVYFVRMLARLAKNIYHSDMKKVVYLK